MERSETEEDHGSRIIYTSWNYFFCTSALLEILFKVPSWELWNGFLFFPIIAIIGALFVVSLPVGVMAWGTGLIHRSVKKKTKAMISILSIVAVALAVFAYLITMNYLEDK